MERRPIAAAAHYLPVTFANCGAQKTPQKSQPQQPILGRLPHHSSRQRLSEISAVQ
jgi:hypothetical protein